MDLDRLFNVFVAESEEQLRELEHLLLDLEARGGDPEALAAVFRLAHTLKGSASTVGLAKVADVAHAMEDLLGRVQSGVMSVSPDLVSLLLDGKDVLRGALQEKPDAREKVTPAQRTLLTRMRRLAQAPAPRATQAMTRREAPSAPEPGGAAPGRPPALPSAAASAALPSAGERGRTLRVDVEKLDRMLDLAGEIGLARVRTERLIRRLEGDAGPPLLEAHRDADRLFLDLQEMILKARMVPLGPTFRQYVRPARDMGARYGKLVAISIEGADVEVDTAIVDRLRDVLTHMVRNALDHGIEPAAERAAAGKPETGTITLRAAHEGAQIVVKVEDDGRGLSRERILSRAASLGLPTASAMTDAEVHEFIFHPGFSTADAVTDMSGRGVGMDVVRREIEALRGSIAVASVPARGTCFTIRLPLTLALIDGIYVGVGQDTYIIPSDVVLELHSPEASDGFAREGVFALRGDPVPYVNLRRVFDIPAGTSRPSIVVVKGPQGPAGLVVDALYGQRQTVIKPMSPLFEDLAVVSGSAILGSGRVALILDVPALLRDQAARRSEAAAAGPGR